MKSFLFACLIVVGCVASPVSDQDQVQTKQSDCPIRKKHVDLDFTYDVPGDSSSLKCTVEVSSGDFNGSTTLDLSSCTLEVEIEPNYRSCGNATHAHWYIPFPSVCPTEIHADTPRARGPAAGYTAILFENPGEIICNGMGFEGVFPDFNGVNRQAGHVLENVRLDSYDVY